jgi:hypothetical protein
MDPYDKSVQFYASASPMASSSATTRSFALFMRLGS